MKIEEIEDKPRPVYEHYYELNSAISTKEKWKKKKKKKRLVQYDVEIVRWSINQSTICRSSVVVLFIFNKCWFGCVETGEFVKKNNNNCCMGYNYDYYWHFFVDFWIIIYAMRCWCVCYKQKKKQKWTHTHTHTQSVIKFLVIPCIVYL